jgi:hypothetical protein
MVLKYLWKDHLQRKDLQYHPTLFQKNWCNGSKRSWKAKGFCSCHHDLKDHEFILLVVKNYMPIRIVESIWLQLILRWYSRVFFAQESCSITRYF